MNLVLLIALGVMTIVAGVALEALSRVMRERDQLRVKLEDGEVMSGKATDPPAAIRRIRQDR